MRQAFTEAIARGGRGEPVGLERHSWKVRERGREKEGEEEDRETVEVRKIRWSE